MNNITPTILVAEDDADIRTIVSGAISSLGFSVIEAEDGAKAISIINDLEIDLAILDYMMPEKNGLEVCECIKRKVGGQYVPVIILTARDAVKDKVSALLQGVDDYLTKPFHYEELQARVKGQLRVRELNLNLKAKNDQLEKAQATIVDQERQILATQLAGTAAHSLGQPLSAIMLNCHLLENLTPDNDKYKHALQAIKSDSKRMAEMLEKLKVVQANQTQNYYGDTRILSFEEDK
jgi:adenylate cyclase